MIQPAMTRPEDTPQLEGSGELDLEALKLRATGGATFMACRHPDIDGDERRPDITTRQCVIDQGIPGQCEFSDPKGRGFGDGSGAITDKTRCHYWAPLEEAEPAGASPEDVLFLVAEISRLTAENTALQAEVEGLRAKARAAATEILGLHMGLDGPRMQGIAAGLLRDMDRPAQHSEQGKKG